MTGEKHFAVLVNPRGGKRHGRRVLARVAPLMERTGAQLTVRFTERTGDAARLAQGWDLDGYTGLCVIGGDGTVHEVVNGLMARCEPSPIPVGLIPAGTGNTLHGDLGCAAPETAAAAILGGAVRRIDVARVRTGGETIYCVNIVGWGAAAEINRTAEMLRWLGPIRYAAASFCGVLAARPRTAQIDLDGGERFEGEFLLVIGCNTTSTGSRMRIAPDAKLDDGLIDVVALRPASRGRLFRALGEVLGGRPLALPAMVHRQTSGFTIESVGREPLNLDGEMQGTAPATVKMLPRALPVFCPADRS